MSNDVNLKFDLIPISDQIDQISPLHSCETPQYDIALPKTAGVIDIKVEVEKTPYTHIIKRFPPKSCFFPESPLSSFKIP